MLVDPRSCFLDYPESCLHYRHDVRCDNGLGVRVMQVVIMHFLQFSEMMRDGDLEGFWDALQGGLKYDPRKFVEFLP